MLSEFRKTLRSYCNKKDTLIVATSGGADSVALLHMLFNSGYKNIIVAHINHNIRRESKKDVELVHKYCEKFDYTFECASIDIKEFAKKKKIGVEEAGRIKRYEFFRELKKEYKTKYILTAHHSDDHLETVILNLIRGSGVRGLSGLQVISGDILRPLLHAKKREILTYCRKHRLKFNEDITNKNTDYSRNFIRHEIVPKFIKLNPNLKETIRITSNIFGELSEYLKLTAEKYITRQKNNRYSLTEFREFPQAIQSEILRTIYLQTHKNLTNLTYNHLQQVLKIINQKKSGKIKEFGKDHYLKTEYYYFSIEQK